MDYELPNKLNIIFQTNLCVVLRLYRDKTDMYKNVLCCYMKNFFIRLTTIGKIDPKSSVNFLDIPEIYLCVNVSSEINKTGKDKINVFLMSVIFN